MTGGNGAAGPADAAAYTGEAVLRFGGRDVPLRLRYREIAALRSLYGAEWPDRYREAIDGDAAVMAKILSVMSGLTEDEVFDLTPAGHIRVADAMLDMYFVAQYGPEWREKRDEARAVTEAGAAEGPLLATLTRLLTALRQRQQSASRPATSGA